MKDHPTEETVPMDPETLEALQGSIAKWESIVEGKGRDEGAPNCPLCLKFVMVNGNCDGCPVAESVGRSDCQRTPYVTDWHEVNPWPREHPNWRRAKTDAHRAAAQKEVDFLKSLLPEQTP